MRSFKALLPVLVLAAACSGSGARVEVNLADAPDSEVIFRQLDLNSFSSSDTVRTSAAGVARYSLPVKEGEPEFLYVFYKDTKIASLLLSAGDNVKVVSDTLGHSTVEGSEESVLLAANEAAFGLLGAKMERSDDPAELSRLYVDHYRQSVRYVLEHPGSLTVVPVLFEQLDAATPVFSQYTDAILFRQATDSLKLRYPASRYVQALEKETVRRENALTVNNMLSQAEQLGYPDIEMPSTDGTRRRLSEVDSKVVLLHFWDSSDPALKMFNLDALMPLWDNLHGKGLQIYSVDVNTDKSAWASVVKAQKLPWINVNDGLGAVQAVNLYNVEALPATFILSEGSLASASVKNGADLQKELAKLLLEAV